MPRFLSALRTALSLLAFTALSVAQSSAAEIEKYLPEDSEAVVHVNVRQILDSPVFQKYGADKLEEGLSQREELSRFLVAAGIDPLKDVASLTLSSTVGASPKVFMVVHGRFDPTKVHAVIEQIAKTHPDAIAIHPQGNSWVYEAKNKEQGKPMFGAVVNRETLVISSSRDHVADACAGAEGKGRTSIKKDLQALVAGADDKQSVWMVALATDTVKKGLAKNPQTSDLANKLISITGELAFTDAIRTGLHVQTSDAKAAADLGSLLDGIKGFFALAAQNVEHYGPLLSDVIETLKVSSEQNRVTISSTVSDDMITKGLKKAQKRQ